MALSRDKNYKISLLQDNLQTLRKIAGWTIEDLGERIGVTKQTISNLENGNTKMSLTQYIALRVVLDYAMRECPENTVLAQAVNILLDAGSQLTNSDYSKLKEILENVAVEGTYRVDAAGMAKIFGRMLKSADLDIVLEQLDFKRNSSTKVASWWLKELLEQY